MLYFHTYIIIHTITNNLVKKIYCGDISSTSYTAYKISILFKPQNHIDRRNYKVSAMCSSDKAFCVTLLTHWVRCFNQIISRHRCKRERDN